MGYRQLVDSAVTKAFNAAKDLAIDVTFNRKTDQSFNFNTGLVTSTPLTVLTKAIKIEEKKTANQRNTVSCTLMVKTNGLEDIKMFESVTFEGATWKIGNVPKNDGYVSLVEVLLEK